jgi:periplasmic protein TonB
LRRPGYVDDAAWRRLGLVVPGVSIAWLMVLWILGMLLAREPIPPAPKPIDATLIELPREPTSPQESPQAPRVPARPVMQQPRPVPAPVPEAATPMAQPEEEAKPPSAATPAPTAPPAQPPTPQPQAPSAAQSARTGARAIFNPLPKIPDELRDRASTAEALARFEIRADGTVSVELVNPTPDPVLNRVILETLRTWRFFPATENGKPVTSSQEVRMRLEVR